MQVGQPGDAWEMCAKLVRNVLLMRMNKSHPSLIYAAESVIMPFSSWPEPLLQSY